MAQQVIEDVCGDVRMLVGRPLRRHCRSGACHLAEHDRAGCAEVAIQSPRHRDGVDGQLDQRDEVVGRPVDIRRIPRSVQMQIEDRREMRKRSSAARGRADQWRDACAAHHAASAARHAPADIARWRRDCQRASLPLPIASPRYPSHARLRLRSPSTGDYGQPVTRRTGESPDAPKRLVDHFAHVGDAPSCGAVPSRQLSGAFSDSSRRHGSPWCGECQATTLVVWHTPSQSFQSGGGRR